LSKKKDVIQTTGKRKKAIARAVARPGSGKVVVNGTLLDFFQPEAVKLMIKEPIILSGINDLDIDGCIRGGGVLGQAVAAREAVAKSLVEHDKTLKEKFVSYDRTMLVSDSRRTEPHHPSASKRGSRRHKQKSKR
jgi:small subunit ribosomal protein S9